MGTYVGGVYVPSYRESGWDDELGDFLTRTGEQWINVKAAPYGAKGDGTTNDSAAIQAAINTGKPVIYFPPGAPYRIGTTLTARAGQTYVGSNSARSHLAASTTLICTGGNHRLWNIANADNATWNGLNFEDALGVATYGVGDDTIFYQGDGEISGAYWVDCRTLFVKWAFDVGGTANFLSNRMLHCNFRDSPSRFIGGGYFNNLGWDDCVWNPVRKLVPALEIGHGGISDKKQMLYVHGSYFESCTYSAVKLSGPSGFSIGDTYFEDIGTASGYTARDGRAWSTLPIIDVTNPNVTGTVPFPNGISLGQNFYGVFPGTPIVGCTDWTKGYNWDVHIETPQITNYAYGNLDLANFWNADVGARPPQMENNYAGSIATTALRSQPNHVDAPPNITYTPDWAAADNLVVNMPNNSYNGGTITIANPYAAPDGAVLTVTVYQWLVGLVTQMLTPVWGAKFVLSAVFAAPGSNKHKQIRFRYNKGIDKWIELDRTADF